jgi:thiosulfate reductase cytochrome b subunit
MMKKYLLIALLALMATGSLAANDFHPEVPLLDASGELVANSGLPLSVEQTCDACHDAGFIVESSDHAIAGVFEGGEVDCLVCHSDPGAERDWAAEAFRPDGVLLEGSLNIHKPKDENCAQCHGIVSTDLELPLTVSASPDDFNMTDLTGQIISPQKVSNSGLNIAGKESLTHPFDVHSDRVVGCVNCHYSLNNPVYFQQRRESRPEHLEFDPRRLTSADYLERPLHQLAKGNSTYGLQSTESENSMRRCESCHTAENVHDWLPYKKRHFASLACESCHVPKLYGPALQAVDETLVDAKGRALLQYRDVEGDPATADSLIHGFRPVMLPRENVGGTRKLAPFNLVSHWYWTAGEEAARVSTEQLFTALYEDGALHPQLARALDRDGDGRVADHELRIDTHEQADMIRQRLQAAGLEQVQLAGEVMPYSISHSVVNGRWATRQCDSCHGADSVLAAPFTLSNYLPAGLLPLTGGSGGVEFSGAVSAGPEGGARFLPDNSQAGYYIIGLDGLDWVDQLGLLMFLGITFGVTVHAIGRYIANRRRPSHAAATRREYMYDVYERLWHWLQAGMILTLLFTGLVIHKPHVFGIFSFAYVVQVHNVLGFILLINAALALFYTLASGTIKRFLPAPKGFFGRAMAQTMYYTRGIFSGESHPLEKTKEHRLNPLQQVTYLAILNILLPAQVITGVLIWGMQEWPQLAASLGGLPVLAPVHTFLAWAFSAFIVMHVYLTTAAGETAGAGIKSMVSGWEEVEVPSDADDQNVTEANHA